MLFYIIFLGTLIADFLTKYLTTLLLKPGHSVQLIGTFLQFTHVQNYGAAFGILQGQRYFLIPISFLFAICILWIYFKEKPRDPLSRTALGLLLAGTIGNLYNRLFQGYVIDFIDLYCWPTFNIADSALNVGMLLLVWQVLRSGKTRKSGGNDESGNN
jgi:signal peptidase II